MLVGPRRVSRKEEKVLPEGWTTEILEKKSGKTKGSKYTYYYDPTGRRFRSIKEIERYLGAELAGNTARISTTSSIKTQRGRGESSSSKSAEVIGGFETK